MGNKVQMIKNIPLPSKIFLAPINTGFSNQGHLSDDLFTFHRMRSGNGIGISYVGNVAVSNGTGTNINTLTICENNKKEWKQLASIINGNKSVAGMQLGCKLSDITAQREWINPNKEEYLKQARQEILGYDTTIFKDIVNKYVAAAKLAWRCGFKVIQIHAAHGYLLSLLLSSSFNLRHDRYGVQYLGLISEIVNQINLEIPQLIIDIRISVFEGIGTFYQEFYNKKSILDKLVKLPVDIISLSNGIYNINKYYIYPPSNISASKFISLGRYFAMKYPDTIWNVAGNICDLDIIRLYDLPNLTYSVGRTLIRDPLFISKYNLGFKNKIKACTHCGNCHYYSQDRSMMDVACEIIS